MANNNEKQIPDLAKWGMITPPPPKAEPSKYEKMGRITTPPPTPPKGKKP